MSDPRRAKAGAGSDDLTGTSLASLPPAAPDVVHGTAAELESWLRAAAAGRPWWPQPECRVCALDITWCGCDTPNVPLCGSSQAWCVLAAAVGGGST